MVELIIEKLSFRYKGAIEFAIRNVCCRTKLDGISALVGRSGVGKSTLMALISGIYTLQDEIVGCLSGEIMLDGCTPGGLRTPNVISWVPQEPALLDHLTVVGNIILPLTVGNATLNHEKKKRCVEIVKSLGMVKHKNARPRELSGGMRTRVSIARALISRPTYLFLDEPFISLDVANRWSMYELLQSERKNCGLCTLFTTHDIPEAMLLAHRVLVLEIGRDGETMITIKENEPADLNGGFAAVLLMDARRRAQELEREMYLG